MKTERKIKFKIGRAKHEFNSRKTDYGTRMKVRDEVRKQFAELDNLVGKNEIPNAIQELQMLSIF